MFLVYDTRVTLLVRPKPALFRTYDLKKIYYYLNYKKIPYKDFFFYQPYFRLCHSFHNLTFFVYGGRFWFKVRVLRWNTGLSVRFFTWPKRPAVFKKKKK
uniref:Ribosomal protein S19 n=1 Tax=Euplotes vannus TaxID=5939 RepID=A0A8A9WR65_EUPVA|nr:ribosomal protein S19 [Euplotes vannus]